MTTSLEQLAADNTPEGRIRYALAGGQARDGLSLAALSSAAPHLGSEQLKGALRAMLATHQVKLVERRNGLGQRFQAVRLTDESLANPAQH